MQHYEVAREAGHYANRVSLSSEPDFRYRLPSDDVSKNMLLGVFVEEVRAFDRGRDSPVQPPHADTGIHHRVRIGEPVEWRVKHVAPKGSV